MYFANQDKQNLFRVKNYSPIKLCGSYQSNACVGESNSCNDGQKSNKLVRVFLELEVHRSREHDGPDQLALDGAKTGSQYYCANAMPGIVTGLKKKLICSGI